MQIEATAPFQDIMTVPYGGTVTGRFSSRGDGCLYDDGPDFDAARYRKYGHRVNRTGYGDWKFNMDVFRARVQRVREDLRYVVQKHNADSIAVRGTSGICMAFALQMFITLPILMLRKKGEQSHGELIEGRDGHNYQRYVIVDDMICTGATVRGIIEDVERAECVALLMHSQAEDLNKGFHEYRYSHQGIPVYGYNEC
jgi:hypothetical protein